MGKWCARKLELPSSPAHEGTECEILDPAEFSVQATEVGKQQGRKERRV